MKPVQWVTFETNEGKIDAIESPHLSEDEMYDQGLLPEGSVVRGYVSFANKRDAIFYTETVLMCSVDNKKGRKK